MISRFLLCFPLIFVFSWFCAAAKAEDMSAQEQPQVFTNQDIEKYTRPSDTIKAPTKRVFQEDREENRKDKNQRIMEEHEMEYWCDRATTCNRKIEDEKEAIKEIEDEIFEAKTKGSYRHKKNATLEKKLESAKKRLRKAEGDLNALEHEAHRKGAKPGWLRCQT